MSDRSVLEPCANCGESIGELEVPHLFEQHVVCKACYKKLSNDAAQIPDSEFREPIAPAVTRSTWSPGGTATLERPKRAKARDTSDWAFFIALVLILFGCMGLVLLFFSSEGSHESLVFKAGTFLSLSLIPGGLLGCFLVILLPIAVAQKRRHSNLSGVRALTYLSFLIPVLWIVAIVWAYSAPDPHEPNR